jgi:hypothetical protein
MTASLHNVRRWSVQRPAELLLKGEINSALSRCAAAAAFARWLLEGCAIRFRDIIDHVTFADASRLPALRQAGWSSSDGIVYRHAEGYFPDFVQVPGDVGIAFRTESVEQFCRAHRLTVPIEGQAHGPMRKVRAFEAQVVTFWAIERNGHAGYEVPQVPASQVRAARLHGQAFRARRRQFDTAAQGLAHTERLVDAAVADLGCHWACDLFFRAEREYFTARCDAARLQHQRQHELGVGWANIDHHTYDSSREWFQGTIRIFEKLGYQCRELFYAGTQAGWGSQILEQPVLRSSIFADIDLAPEELDVDFAHQALPPLPHPRRAGLWCAMHGESMLEAGLNHIAGLYEQDRLRAQLALRGITMMAPFSDFPELYQELTYGQWRPVDPTLIDRLESAGHLSREEAEEFRLNGAIATHLENIERNDGFKGFNQPGIDGVLRIIDPRVNLSPRAEQAVGAR